LKRRSARPRSRPKSGWAIVGGIMLVCGAGIALVALAYFYVTAPQKLRLDQASLCPVTGHQGVTVVLVDTTDDLPETTQREAVGILDDLITNLAVYHKLDIRVLDVAQSRSLSLFAKCNPGDGAGLSEWTANPVLARKRWIEEFEKPALAAIKHSLASAKDDSSPIMAAIQDIALDQFSAAAVQGIPKSLIVISDMLEFTQDYSQYPKAGDLSYERYRRSSAYQKFQTNLHGARVAIKYVQRPRAMPAKIASRHIEFWREWITDNLGAFVSAQRLQGA
jgi:hypothetical protein